MLSKRAEMRIRKSLKTEAALRAAGDMSLERRIVYLGKAIHELQTEVAKLRQRDTAERVIASASQRGINSLVPGTRVRYHRVPDDPYAGPIVWTGIVCPRPANLRQCAKDGERLIYVVSDHGRVYGCRGENLTKW